MEPVEGCLSRTQSMEEQQFCDESIAQFLEQVAQSQFVYWNVISKQANYLVAHLNVKFSVSPP